MAAPPREENARPPLLRAGFLLLALLLGLSLSLDTRSFSPIVQGVRSSIKIVDNSRAYERQIEANEALRSQNAYLRTPEGTEWLVYRDLGLVRPGQQVGRVEEAQPAPAAPPTHRERLQRWMQEHQDAATARLRAAGETLRCYAGLRPLDQRPEDRNQGAAGVSKEPKRQPKSPTHEQPRGAKASSSPVKTP